MQDNVTIIPFKREHMMDLVNHPSLSSVKKYLTEDRIKMHETCGHSFTLITIDGIVLGIAGVVPMWDNVGEAWAIFNPNIKERFLYMHRAVKRYLNTAPFKRIQMTVDCKFINGHRWARLLGFKKEADKLEKYMPDGKDVSMYAMVRG